MVALEFRLALDSILTANMALFLSLLGPIGLLKRRVFFIGFLSSGALLLLDISIILIYRIGNIFKSSLVVMDSMYLTKIAVCMQLSIVMFVILLLCTPTIIIEWVVAVVLGFKSDMTSNFES